MQTRKSTNHSPAANNAIHIMLSGLPN